MLPEALAVSRERDVPEELDDLGDETNKAGSSLASQIEICDLVAPKILGNIPLEGPLVESLLLYSLVHRAGEICRQPTSAGPQKSTLNLFFNVYRCRSRLALDGI